jgi:hypothetical protein
MLMISVCNIFDSSKSDAPRLTLREMIKQLPSSSLLHREDLTRYLSALGHPELGDLPDLALSERASEVLLVVRPTHKSCERLQRVTEYRNKIAVHREAVDPATLQTKFEDADWCLDWAKKFLIAICGAYLGTHCGNGVHDFYTTTEAMRTSLCMKRILEDLEVVEARYPGAVARRRAARIDRRPGASRTA